MSIRANAKRDRGFTLLEVMIGVLIIALITLSIYKFVVGNLMAIRVSSEVNDDRRSLVALVRMVEAELQDLPPRTNGALQGISHKFDGQPSDEMQWYCKAGNGLMTGAAEGEWFTTLAILRNKTTREMEIGLRRRPIEAKESQYDWWPLLTNVNGLEVRYFDARLGANGWIERWSDKNTRPALVRLRIWRNADDPPYESVIALPSANLQQ
jgi:prepilin-type N-terminal cleavage/methylation domain-containing protein